jgi:hypothetical protein
MKLKQKILNEVVDRKSIRNFIIAWNIAYPLDKWWRDKYNIAFNSQKHRDSNILDVCIEYEEMLLFKPRSTGDKDKDEFDEMFKTHYVPGHGLVLTKRDNDVFEDDDKMPDWFNDIDKQ